jgi:outer membrane receptor protein involved in Fe transport
VRWLAGANYEHSEVFQANRIVYPEGSAGNGLGFLFGYPIDDLEYSSDQEMNNWAVFASGEFDITSNLSLTVGARYTETEREAILCSVDPGPSFIVGPFFYDVFGGGAFGPYTEGACFPINNIGVDYLPPGSPGEFRDKLEEDNVARNISPKWRLNDDVLLYLTVSEGYKAGSYATLSASTFQQFLPITQESVMAYELGTKASFAEGRAQLNMAVFHYEYEDKQLLSKLSDVTFGLLRVLQNVPESTIDGVEIELTARPVEPIVFTLAGTYMDGKIDEFTGMNSGGVQADFSGSALPSTPEWQGSADIEYQFEIGGYPAYLGLSYSYRSEMASIVGGDIIPSDYVGIAGAPYMIDSYETVDVRAGITSPDERWSAKIWGKNILDEYYWYDTLQNTVDQVVRYPAMPATYGASIAYHFF